MATTKTTKSKLGLIITFDWVKVKPYITEMYEKGLEVHLLIFNSAPVTQPDDYQTLLDIGSMSKKHILREPAAQGMDCIGPVLTAVNYGFEFAKTEKKDIHTIVNTLTIPKTWNFDTTLDNWKKLFWFQWDHKEYVDDVVVRTWNEIKPKPAPIVVEESTEE
jgi:hypothetical protein